MATGNLAQALRDTRALVVQRWADGPVDYDRMLAHHVNGTTLCDLLGEACGADIDLRIEAEEWLRPWVAEFSVMLWSERVGRTKAEVVALLAKAILRAEQLARAS